MAMADLSVQPGEPETQGLLLNGCQPEEGEMEEAEGAGGARWLRRAEAGPSTRRMETWRAVLLTLSLGVVLVAAYFCTAGFLRQGRQQPFLKATAVESPTAATHDGSMTLSRYALTGHRALLPQTCSKPGEDCSKTAGQCCGQGMQCYWKSEFYAACRATCNADTTGWFCTKLGKRTPQVTDGTWAGEECTLTRKCNNKKTKCVRKDAESAYCAFHVDPSWDGEVIGPHRTEYAVEPAPAGAPVWGTTLFCFMAVLPGSAEEQLVAAAKARWASVFSCNASAIYNSKPSTFVHDGTWNSFANTDSFIKVWEMVRDDGRFRNYDWTVKADPDCVFMPYRLMYHLASLRAPQGKPIYLKNSKVAFGFLGAVEIVNQLALINYFDSYQDCHRTMPSKGSGEDGWLKDCLDAIGVGFMMDATILRMPMDKKPCTDPTRVAFHPHKKVNDWISCYNLASGR